MLTKLCNVFGYQSGKDVEQQLTAADSAVDREAEEDGDGAHLPEGADREAEKDGDAGCGYRHLLR